MNGWLFVFAVALLMAAVVYFAWQSDTAAIAEQRDGAPELDEPVDQPVDDAPATR